MIDELAAHLAAFGEGPDRLLFTNERRAADPSATGSPRRSRGRQRRQGSSGVTFHDLRHHFASVLIGAGCSIKAVEEALGHANASETLDTYRPLWPADEDRMRAAVDGAWSSRVTGVSQPMRRGGVDASDLRLGWSRR